MTESDDFQSSWVTSLLPESLLDVEKEMLSWRHSEHPTRVSSLEKFCEELEAKYDDIDKMCSDFKKEEKAVCEALKAKIAKKKEELEGNHKEETELEFKVERNKTLLAEMKTGVNEEELAELMKKVCTLREEMENQKRSVVSECEQFQKGVLCYKKYLHWVAFCVSEAEVIMSPNYNAKSVADVKDYVKLSVTQDKDTRFPTFHYVEMKPELEEGPFLVKRLEETGDVQFFLLAFLKALQKTGQC